jgi:hypothetical protein
MTSNAAIRARMLELNDLDRSDLRVAWVKSIRESTSASHIDDVHAQSPDLGRAMSPLWRAYAFIEAGLEGHSRWEISKHACCCLRQAGNPVNPGVEWATLQC